MTTYLIAAAFFVVAIAVDVVVYRAARGHADRAHESALTAQALADEMAAWLAEVEQLVADTRSQGGCRATPPAEAMAVLRQWYDEIEAREAAKATAAATEGGQQ